MRPRLFLAAITLAACGHVETPTVDAHKAADAPATADAPPPPDARPPDAMPGVRTFTANSTWNNCPTQVDCEDVYDFDVAASGTVSATVSAVTMNSVPRLELFQGTATTGTNLFDNAATPVCGTMDTDLSAGPTAVAATHYRLAAGRDWGNSAGLTGTYTITITATVDLDNVSQTADDAPSNLPHCP